MKHIDEEEFAEFVEIVQEIDLYKAINPTNTELFFSDLEEGRISNLEYSVDIEHITSVKKRLVMLKEKITESVKFPELIKKAYVDKITEEICLAEMLIAVTKKDDATVFEMSKKVYGLPEVKTVASTLSKFESDLAKGGVDCSRLVELKKLFAWSKNKDKMEIDEMFYSSEEEKGSVRGSEYIVGAFVDALEESQIDGWVVEISDEVRAISVDSKNKKIRVPHDREVTDLHLKALVNHEIRTHVKRFAAGDSTQMKLLGYGLASYEAAEEGLAMWGERMVEQGSHVNSLCFLLGIAAIAGVFGENYSTIKLYDLLKEYYFLFGKPEQVRKNMVRILRGTTGSSQGACFTKDHIYLSGFVDLLPYLKKDKEFYGLALRGKFDPLNKGHVELVNFVNEV